MTKLERVELLGAMKENHFELGVKLSAQSKYDEAVKEYERVRRSDPNFEQAQLNLKWISFWTRSKSDEFISRDENRWNPGRRLSQRFTRKEDQTWR